MFCNEVFTIPRQLRTTIVTNQYKYENRVCVFGALVVLAQFKFYVEAVPCKKVQVRYFYM